MKRDAFYRTIAWLEEQSDGIITDYSDERYTAAARPFKYKRVDKSGSYLDREDPRRLLVERERHEIALRQVANFFGYLKEKDLVEDFVEQALEGSYVARSSPTADELLGGIGG